MKKLKRLPKSKDRLKRPAKGRVEKTTKRKPSKSELKAVIEGLKTDPDLLLVRKALKYTSYYLKSEGLTKKLLKEIIRLWSESGEKIRIVCLLALIRIYTKLKDKERKLMIVKQLYTAFLDKCRITKQETMSMIGFMRHSLVELYKLDPQLAFKQSQTSCQQLTVTLKNACTHKNEETYKTVLNWQFANCLTLLTNIIVSQDENSPVKSLAHQVIQLNLGSLNLLSSPRYYPFYCHLIENLINLSITTNLFIPILPILVGLLEKVKLAREKPDKNRKKEEANKKGKKRNMKKRSSSDDDEDADHDSEENVEDEESEIDYDDNSNSEKDTKPKEYNMDLLNHVSMDEAHSPGYIKAVLDRLHELIVRYLASQCHRIAFPELVLLPCVQIKKWTKNNHGEPVQKFKLLLNKIKGDCEKIEEARRSVDFAFTDYSAVDAWEKRMKDTKKLSLPKMISKQ